MKRWLSTIVFAMVAHSAWSQITITMADMPVHGDSLRYSNATAIGTPVSAADSGENISWSYALTPVSQGLDDYMKPTEVSPLYALTLASDCYGYKIADSIPGIGLLLSGITINNLYTFFNEYVSPAAFGAEAFGAQISGFPVGANYVTPDAWYFLPLAYNNSDSSDFYLKFGLPSVATIKEKGYRKTRVDGWGTIVTPYFTTPTNCLRIRSEIHEVDSVSLDSISFGLPRVTVEYKYLVNGEHYPAVWATANVIPGLELEVISSVKYKDIYRPDLNPTDTTTTAVTKTAPERTQVMALPNPAVNGQTTLSLPRSWRQYYVEVFNTDAKAVVTLKNTNELDMRALPPGNYMARVTCGTQTAYIKIVR